MQLCFFSGRVIRAFVMGAGISMFVFPVSAQHAYESCNASTGSAILYELATIQDKTRQYVGDSHNVHKNNTRRAYASMGEYTRVKTREWFAMEKRKRTFRDTPCIQEAIDEFFRVAILANAERCGQEHATHCAKYDNWAKKLYESAVKNGHTSLASIAKANNPYVQEEALKVEEAAAAKKKAAEEEAKKKVDAIDFALENVETYIKIDLKPIIKKMDYDENVLTILDDMSENFVTIEKLIDQTKMKTINSQGITRTMYCNPKCTLGSPMLQSNSTGINIGIPLVVYDGISEALIEAFDGENPLKKSQIIKLGISSYKEMAKTINDPNINKAMAMPAEQLKQIKAVQTQVQASRQKKSDGSAEEGPGTASAMSSGSSPPSSLGRGAPPLLP